MKIQIWSDIMCPFCYLGDKNLQNAIEEYQGSEKIEIEFKAFQLNPAQPKTANPDNPINYTLKNGYPEMQVRNSFKYIENEANQLGLPIAIENAKVVNSQDCLRLLKFAESKGKLKEVKQDLYESYFAYAKDLSDLVTLLEIATKNGLNRTEVEQLLVSEEGIEGLTRDRNEGISKGLKGVPFFIIDDAHILSGNQSKETFLKLMNNLTPSSTDNAASCDIETGNCN